MSQENYISTNEKQRLLMKNEEANIYFDKVEVVLKDSTEIKSADLVTVEGKKLFIVFDESKPLERCHLVLNEKDLKNNHYILKSINIYTIDKEIEKIERNIALQHPKGITNPAHPFSNSYVDDYLNLKNFCIGKMKNIIIEHYNDYKGDLDKAFKAIVTIELAQKLNVPKNEFIDAFNVLKEGYINRELLRNNQERTKEIDKIKKPTI